MTDKNPNQFLNFVAGIFLVGFIVFVLKELQSILLPLFIGVIISFIFLPFYNFLVKKKIPAAISVIVVLLTIIIISNIASLIIFTSINSFSAEFPKYENKFLDVFNSFIAKLDLSDDDIANFNNSLNLKTLIAGGKLTGAITGILTGVTGIMGNYILILFYVIFILSESESLKGRLSAAFAGKNDLDITKTLNDIFSGVKEYIAGKTLLSFLQAVLIGTFLWICGVDFYLVWGFLFFISDFIPNIGSLIVSVLVAAVMLLQFESIVKPAVILAVLIIIQNLKGNIIEPKIFGHRLDLSPLVLFFSLIFWGYIWGIIGMILSVPIMSMIKITFMNIPATKPIAILMSNSAPK